MISLDQRERALECTVCGEKQGISLVSMMNERDLGALTERMREDHASCEQHAHNPARAQAERQYTLRMRALLRGFDDKNHRVNQF
jgi:5-methylcytosine-specific restriction endonuclease McrA